MHSSPAETAHHFYALYQTLPLDTQQAFLKELLENQHEQLETLSLYLACQQAKDENSFLSDEEAESFINSLPQ